MKTEAFGSPLVAMISLVSICITSIEGIMYNFLVLIFYFDFV